ncbi:hypothetical protein, partial [Klebsiella quasipneumoniae]|uniref:hypothetical protein n=1 Tax=Klebsiella quasipneumoniae TaxID=1463165 RepID=UPI0021693356
PLNNNRSIPLTNLKISVQKVVLFYCALAGQHQKIRNFPGINIHHFYTNDEKTVSPHPIISCSGSVFIFK